MASRIGIRVRAARRRAGLTQVELCRQAKIAQPYLSVLERRDNVNPSIYVLRRLCAVLHIPMMSLLE